MINKPIYFKNFNIQTYSKRPWNSVCQNNYRLMSGLTKDTVSFSGNEDNGNYNFIYGLPKKITPEVEKAYAKYLIDEDDWMEIAKITYIMYWANNLNPLNYIFGSSPEDKIQQFVIRIGKLRSELLNERIQQKNDEANKLEEAKTDEKL